MSSAITSPARALDCAADLIEQRGRVCALRSAARLREDGAS